MKNPLITVIIPTHARGPLLKRALLSVLAQKDDDLIEIIVVSDMVDAETDEVCRDLLGLKDIYIRRKGRPGPAASRNYAMSIASGQYIMFLDDDDSWQCDFMKDFQAVLLRENVVAAYCDCIVVQESRTNNVVVEKSRRLHHLNNQLTPDILVKNKISLPCYIFARGILSGLLFDEAMHAYEDWDFFLFAIERAYPIHIPIVGPIVHEVNDGPSDRRGSSPNAQNHNALGDYLYVYKRHPVQDFTVKEGRMLLMKSAGLNLPAEFL